METKTALEVLAYIQGNLNAPKSQYNSFGKYHYRSCEDILGAAKPLLKEAGAVLILSDNITPIGERYYVQARATLLTGKDDSITCTAFAREAMTKKGMDEAQITGSASSYARKYALNGLFAIDDTKDADATNDHGKKPVRTSATPPQRDAEGFLKPTPTILPEDRAKSLMAIIGDAPGMPELKEYFASHWPEIEKLPAELKNQVINAKNKRKAGLEKELE